jgi:hypothetical protein
MSVVIQIRGDNSTNWTSVNPVLADRELVYDKDNKNFRIGDGVNSYTALPTLGIGSGFTGTNVSGTVNSNGIQLSVAAGGGAGDGWNPIAAGGSTGNSTQSIVFGNANGVSFSLNGSTITASHNGLTDAGAFIATGNSSLFQHTTATSAITSNAFPTANSSNLAVSSVQSRVIGIAGSNASTASGNVQFANGNNVTFGLNGNTITASASYAAQTVQTQGMVSVNGSTGNISITAGSGSSGGSMSVNGSSITFGVATNYSTNWTNITSNAAHSTHSHGNPTLALTNINGTTASASNGLTLSLSAVVPAQTNQGMTLNAVGNTTQVSSLATTANALTFEGAGIASVGFSNNRVVVSVPSGGGAGDGYNIIAAGGSTAGTAATVVFSNANGVSFGLNGSTVTASVNAGGAAGTIGGWEVFPAGNNTTASSLGQRSLYMQKVNPAQNYSFNNIELRMSNSMVTTTNNSAAVSYTLFYGLYSKDGADSYNSIGTSSMAIYGSANSSSSMGITISQGAASFTSQASTATIAPMLSGYKHLYLPFASTLTAGGNYAVGIIASSTTTGGTGALRLAVVHETVINNITVGKIYATTAISSNSTYVGDYNMGVYNSTTNAMPAAVAKSQMTNAVSQARMYLQFEV